MTKRNMDERVSLTLVPEGASAHHVMGAKVTGSQDTKLRDHIFNNTQETQRRK